MTFEAELVRKIAALTARVEALELAEGDAWVFPNEPYTSTSYDGNDTVAVGTYTIDTSATFGLPAGVRAVKVYLRGTWTAASTSNYARLGAVGATLAHVIIYAQVANIPSFIEAIVPCNADGDFELQVGGASMTNSMIRIAGYLL